MLIFYRHGTVDEMIPPNIVLDRSRYDVANAVRFSFATKPGINERVVREISAYKEEPAWVLDKRLAGLKHFLERPVPTWGPDLSRLHLDDITYFADPGQQQSRSWEDVPADIRSTFERLGIPQAEREALAGAGAQYECLAGDTFVYTRDRGAVPIKDIRPGDWVFSYDEKANEIKPARVKGVTYKGVRWVYEVKVGTNKIRATSNHPFLVLADKRKPGRLRSRYAKEWKQLKDLAVGNLVGVAKQLPRTGKAYSLSSVVVPQLFAKVTNQFGVKFQVPIRYKAGITFPKKTNSDLLWLFGFFLGDGFIRHSTPTKGQICFAVHDKDQELRRELIRVVKKLFGYDIVENHPYVLRVSSSLIAQYFEKAGFLGHARSKAVPGWIYGLPREQQLALISGYIDADGHVGKKRGVVMTSVNTGLLQSMRELAKYVGELRTSSITQFSQSHLTDPLRIMYGFRLALTGNIGVLPCRNPKRYKRLPRLDAWRKIPQYSTAKGATFRDHVSDSVGFTRISSIIPLKKEAVYDIEVEGSHNFVAEGLIVHNSAMAYHNLKEQWAKLGVIFENFDTAIQKYPDLVKPYFMTRCVPINDHKFAALHAAVFSGGTFIYVPPNIKVTLPLQAYFRMNAPGTGQFEHTLIVADEGSEVSYLEGCSAPQYTTNNLHAGCVEIFVKRHARVRYTSIENWSKNTYNLNTKRAIVEEDGIIEFLNGNLGSFLTMLYPSAVLIGKGAKADFIGIAYAGAGQNQDTGSKAIHLAPYTSSTIIGKSISKDGGITTYRGLLKVNPGAHHVKSSVNCDALLLDEKSVSNTIPYMDVREETVDIGHEARVGKISAEQLFYLQSRGLSPQQALQLIVSGFIEPVVKQLPLEYAVELNRLIELEMEGSIG